MRHVAVGVGLAVLVVLVYWPVYQFDFVNFDDDVYLVQNQQFPGGLSGENIRWAFTTPYHSNWHPVTWLSFFADYELFGLNPGAFHVTNVVFHLINALLLYCLLVVMTRRAMPSLLVATLFAIHPLHVESVAWISERKDVLSMFFMLLTLLAYVYYTRRPRGLSYAPILLLYAAGLMSKPMLVTLPVLLLLLDVWPLQRTSTATPRQLVVEKVPLFMLALGPAAITYAVQHASGAVRSAEILPFAFRLKNAVISYAAYLASMINPTALSPFYPAHADTPRNALALLCALILAGISVAAWVNRRRYPYLIVGWAWFVLALVPVIGLVQVGEQARADRYVYIPAIGIYFAVVWFVFDAIGPSRRGRWIGATAALVVTGLLVAQASAQVRHWRDSETLFQWATTLTDNNHLAHNNLGVALQHKDPASAQEHFHKAIAIKPDYRDARINLASVYVLTERYDDAIAEYLRALDLAPEEPLIYRNLALALGRANRWDEAAQALQQACSLAPSDAALHVEWADALREKGDHAVAATVYRQASQLGPIDHRVRCNWAVSLIGELRPADARQQLRIVLQEDPDNIDAIYNDGVAAAAMGELGDAVEAFERVLQLAPDHALAQENLLVLRAQ